MSGPRLVVAKGEGAGRVFTLSEGDNLIGRADPEVEIGPAVDLEELDVDARVSRRHAVISRHGTACSIEDLGSLNGTFLNRGPRLVPGARHDLQSGDEIVIGKTFLRFEIGDE